MNVRKFVRHFALALALATLILLPGFNPPSALAQDPVEAPQACTADFKQKWMPKGNCKTNAAVHFLGTLDDQPLVIKTNAAERMRIATNGNVGIGTNAPNQKLVIQTAPGNAGWRHTDGTMTVGSYIGGSASGATGGWLGTVSNHNLHFFTNNGQPSLTIRTNGNVGIGTFSPNYSLDVAGDIRAHSLSAPGNLGLNASPGGFISLQTSTGGALSSRLTVSANGNVGVGTGAPGEKLTVQTATANYGLVHTDGTATVGTWVGAGSAGTEGGWIGTKTNHPFRLFAGGSGAALSVNTTGAIGIGTTNVSAKLHVKTTGTTPSTLGLRVTNGNGDDTLLVDDAGKVLIGHLSTNQSAQHVCINLFLSDCQSAAEYVPSIDGGKGYPQTADLVSIAPSVKNPYGDTHGPFTVQKSTTACDPNLLGFIVNPESGADGIKLNDHYLPLAIYGYFPAKVSMENGVIKRGDALTSSSKPGYAMKATEACKVIGYALEDATAEGQIQVFADLGENAAGQVAKLQARVQELEQQNAAFATQNAALEARLSAIERALQVQTQSADNRNTLVITTR